MKSRESNNGILDRMSALYSKISMFVITPLALLIAGLYLVMITISYKKNDVRDYSSIPNYSISLTELTPSYLDLLRRDFLTKTDHSLVLDNPGYLKLLISLDTNISFDAGSCILYADLFEECGCDNSQNINMSRYLFQREAGRNNWGFVCSGLISLPQYFNPKSPNKSKGGD